MWVIVMLTHVCICILIIDLVLFRFVTEACQYIRGSEIFYVIQTSISLASVMSLTSKSRIPQHPPPLKKLKHIYLNCNWTKSCLINILWPLCLIITKHGTLQRSNKFSHMVKFQCFPPDFKTVYGSSSSFSCQVIKKCLYLQQYIFEWYSTW